MYDVIIIGGGIAGLYYAYKIRSSDPSKKILLVEANKRLGGRAGNVEFHDQSIPIGAGIGRKKKDVLLLKLLHELNIPFREFTASSQYADTIQPKCRVKEMFLFLKKQYNAEKDSTKTFIEYAKPKLVEKYGKNSYENFTICSGYTDYENECAHDTLYYYGFDDNYSDWTGMGFSWNALVDSLAAKIGHSNIHTLCNVDSISTISENEFAVVCKKGRYLCNKIVIATTIESVRKLLPSKSIYSQIKGQHFMRIYGMFSNASLDIMKEKCFDTTIVPGPIHKIIPMNMEKGIFMIAYTDNKGATLLEKYRKNTKKNRDTICRLIELALSIPPNTLELDDMVDFYWSIGTHYYTPIKGGFKNRKEFCYVAQRPEENIRVVGEMISMKQGWVEGALESVESAIQ